VGFLADFIPFYPKKSAHRTLPRPRFDMERALGVMVRPHPSLEEHRAANGELIVSVERELHPTERFLDRFVSIRRRRRRIVLDQYGEFLLHEAARPGVTLGDAADRMAEEFGLDRETARLGAVHLVRDLLLRGVVFLIRPADGASERNPHDDEPDSGRWLRDIPEQ